MHFNRITLPLLTALGAILWTAPYVAAEERSPFTSVKVQNGKAIVVLDGNTVELISIDRHTTPSILEFCRTTYQEKWKKRFAEDLVEVLTRMGRAPGKTVRLVVRDPDTGDESAIPNAGMTAENRRQIMQNRLQLVSDDDIDEQSPFTEVFFDESKPIVRFKGALHELHSIDGLAAERIVDFCRRAYGGMWQERFAEDLVQTLTSMGHEPDNTVRLVLKNLSDGKTLTVPSAAMTPREPNVGSRGIQLAQKAAAAQSSAKTASGRHG